MADNLKRNDEDLTLMYESENIPAQNDVNRAKLKPQKPKPKPKSKYSEEELENIRWLARSRRKWS